MVNQVINCVDIQLLCPVLVKETKTSTPEGKTRRHWELWSAEDKDTFFEALSEVSATPYIVVLLLLSLSSGVKLAMVTGIFSFLSLRSLSAVFNFFLLLLFSIFLPLFLDIS